MSPGAMSKAFSAASYALNNGLSNSYIAMAMIYMFGDVIGKGLGIEEHYLYGGIYPFGCPFEMNAIIDNERLIDNDDSRDGTYSCGLGIYHSHCGFQALEWMNACEILHICLAKSCHSLPDWALYVMRFCRFDAWYEKGAYAMYSSRQDNNLLEMINQFLACINAPASEVSDSDKDLIYSITSELTPVGIAIPKQLVTHP